MLFERRQHAVTSQDRNRFLATIQTSIRRADRRRVFRHRVTQVPTRTMSVTLGQLSERRDRMYEF